MRLQYSYITYFAYSSLADIFNLVQHVLDNAEDGDADEHAQRASHQADDGVQVGDEHFFLHLHRVRLVVDVQLREIARKTQILVSNWEK